MPRDRWDRKFNKLVKRDWSKLSELWLNYDLLGTEPGSPPESSIAELESVKQELWQIDSEEPIDISEEIAGLRKGLLKEGFFQLQKSAYVLSGAQIHISGGMPSWSLSSAYHAAFFAVNGILNLLGVILVELDGRNFLIDVWSKSSEKRKFRDLNLIRLQKIPGLPQQRNLWQGFQRMLKVTAFHGDILTEGCKACLLDFEKNDFSRRRNDIHYRSALWPYDDVRTFITTNDFELDSIDIIDGSVLGDPRKNVFPLALAFIVVRMGCQMLISIVNLSEQLKPELEVFCRWLEGDENVLFKKACGSLLRSS